MQIRYLGNTEELNQVAAWVFNEWGYSKPGSTEIQVADQFKLRVNSKQIPLTIVAVETELLGTASLVRDEMSTHPEFTPWLSCLYIRSDQRQKGLGKTLSERILEEARRLGHDKCYLWTDKWEEYYCKRNWKVLLRETYHGENAVIMEIGI